MASGGVWGFPLGLLPLPRCHDVADGSGAPGAPGGASQLDHSMGGFGGFRGVLGGFGFGGFWGVSWGVSGGLGESAALTWGCLSVAGFRWSILSCGM